MNAAPGPASAQFSGGFGLRASGVQDFRAFVVSSVVSGLQRLILYRCWRKIRGCSSFRPLLVPLAGKYGTGLVGMRIGSCGKPYYDHLRRRS